MNPSILIVEDNQMSRRLVCELLKGQEFDVLEAEDAESALAMIRQRPPDLVLMDVGLPKMSGLTLVGILRHDPLTAHLPVVALSAYARSNEVEAALAAGCDGYIVKPINTRAFRQQVARFLHPEPSQPEGAGISAVSAA